MKEVLNPNRINCGAYFLSQNLWAIILLMTFIITISVSHSHSIDAFTSRAPTQPFNESEDPAYFVHLTDIHVSSFISERAEHFSSAISYIKKITPMATIITGDLADDYNYFSGSLHYSNQMPSDWALYSNLSSQLNSSTTFEVPGNHDEFGVYALHSSGDHFSVNHSVTDSNFSLNVHSITFNSHNYHFVAVAPFIHPTAHTPLLFWPHLPSTLIDNISFPQSDEVILFNHYPLNLYKSSPHGDSFINKATDGRITYFIAGHLHPKKPTIQHHKNLLEVIGPDLKETNSFGVFTFDNGRFVYNHATTSSEYFITSPAPIKQLSARQIFSDGTAPLRVLSFSKNEPSISASGAVEGQLKCRKTVQYDGYICSLPMNLTNGVYTVNLSGSLNHSLEFCISSESPKYKSEEVYESSYAGYYTVILIIVTVIAAIIVIPFPIGSQLEGYDEWIQRRGYGKHWVAATIGSLFTMKYRLAKQPLWMRISLIIATVWPFALPIIGIEIESHPGMIWAYGYVAGGKCIYDVWGQCFALFYFGCVVLPAIMMASSLSYSVSFHLTFLMDLSLPIIGFGVDVYVLFRYAIETSGAFLPWLSPCFVFIPLGLFISLYVSWARAKPPVVVGSYLLVGNDFTHE